MQKNNYKNTPEYRLIKEKLKLRQLGEAKMNYTIYWYNQWLESSTNITKPCAKRAHKNLKIDGKKMKAINNLIVDKWDFAGTYDYVQGRQRSIKSLKPVAIELFKELQSSGYVIPPSLHKKFYYNTKDISNDSLNSLNNYLSSLPISSSARSFYHNTKRSPFRWYHPIQNMSKQDKAQVFKGCIDVDITSCFLSMYWYEMKGKDKTNVPPFHFLLSPHLKKDFENKIMEDFNCDRARAKEIRNNITQCNANGHVSATGVLWYDTLHSWLIGIIRQWGKEVLQWSWGETKPHLIFTYYEEKVISKMMRAGVPLLRMHDGIIFKEVNIDHLRACAYPHILKINTI